jgi:hypothetical protein
MILWGFVAGEEGLKFYGAPKGLKWAVGVVIVIAVVFAVLWAGGVNLSGISDKTLIDDAIDGQLNARIDELAELIKQRKARTALALL